MEYTPHEFIKERSRERVIRKRVFQTKKKTSSLSNKSLLRLSAKIGSISHEPATLANKRAADGLLNYFITSRFAKTPLFDGNLVRIYLTWIVVSKYSKSYFTKAIAALYRICPSNAKWKVLTETEEHKKFLRGAKKVLDQRVTLHSKAMSIEDVCLILTRLKEVHKLSHDQLLFRCILLLGFFNLHRLGELTRKSSSKYYAV